MSNSEKLKIILNEQIESQIKNIALSNATLLITGESGVGKDIVANRVHSLSKRSKYNPVVINVAAIPIDLIEKELFGSKKGAFTDSNEDYIGKFQLADKSTLILDEIAELPLFIQGKLLKAIENGTIQPLGCNETIKVDCRIIGVTNKNLLQLIELGKFRKDLYYRLNVITLHIPPLRERIKEIKLLTNYFLDYYSNLEEEYKYTIHKKAMDQLLSYNWPGNIRELKNCIERAITLNNKQEITSEYLLLSSDNNVNISSATLKEALDDFKRKYITQVLESNNWNVTKSAKILDIQRTYLSRLIKELYKE